MVRYIDYLTGKSSGYLLDYGLGEWGAYDKSTSVGFTVSCTYFHLAESMVFMAEMLGKDDYAKKYTDGIVKIEKINGSIKVSTGSGRYVFNCKI